VRENVQEIQSSAICGERKQGVVVRRPTQRSCSIDTMLPRWSTNGDLPPGVHFATWQELEDRLTFNPRRQRMLAGFRQACEQLRKAGCRLVYLDGSFVTRKERPGDLMLVGTSRTSTTPGSIQSSWISPGAARRRSSGFWESCFRHNCLKVRPAGRLWISSG
jgi:hypothetical protein